MCLSLSTVLILFFNQIVQFVLQFPLFSKNPSFPFCFCHQHKALIQKHISHNFQSSPPLQQQQLLFCLCLSACCNFSILLLFSIEEFKIIHRITQFETDKGLVIIHQLFCIPGVHTAQVLGCRSDDSSDTQAGVSIHDKEGHKAMIPMYHVSHIMAVGTYVIVIVVVVGVANCCLQAFTLCPWWCHSADMCCHCKPCSHQSGKQGSQAGIRSSGGKVQAFDQTTFLSQ